MRAWEEHVVSKNVLTALAVLALLIAFALGLLAWPHIAQAEEKVSFGIRPTKAHEDIPESFSYFVHTLAPGTRTLDAALVMNQGDVPITLKLYAADAVTAINGGTSFANDGEEKNGVARWLSSSVTELLLQPDEERVVPFAIKVPADASPGQHVAGLVVEAVTVGEEPANGSDQTRLTVNVVRRAGVAVLIDVPGTHVAGLEITGMCLKQQDADHGATFEVAVRNTGNVYVRGQGLLTIGRSDGMTLASIPMEMDTVLAGDATYFQVTRPYPLPDGSYLVNATLDYAEGKTTTLEGEQVTVSDGQPECGPAEAAPQASPVALGATLTPSEGGDGSTTGRWAIYTACAAALMAAAVAVPAAAAILVRRTRAKRSLAQPQRSSVVSVEAKVKPKLDQSRVGYRSPNRYGVYAASFAALAVAAPTVLLVRKFGTRRPHHR